MTSLLKKSVKKMFRKISAEQGKKRKAVSE